jgi:glutamate dehydrogenase (NADP+)
MNEFTGVLTGKGINWGGSLVRPEATGFGIVYFTEEVLNTIGETIKGKRVAISGFGNVAWGAVQKVNDLGGKVVTLSGPDGYIYDEDGVSGEKIDFMVTMRNSNRDLVQDYSDKYPSAKFFPGKRPWEVPVDVAIPCATQNELNEEDAMNLINNKCICVVEGANMPCFPKAIEAFQKAKMPFAPGKAANAGGVATSGLEMTQNAMHLSWPREEVDARLREIMKNIHQACVEHGKEPNGYINYVKGANIAGFMKVANAMCDQGLV